MAIKYIISADEYFPCLFESQQFGVEAYLDVRMNIALSMLYRRQYCFQAPSSPKL